MPPKAPSFTPQGVVQTGTAVQMGCIYCLSEGLQAPAEHHVAYIYQGTSYCAKHIKAFLTPQEAE
jgi:hypothetical protein